MSTTTKELIEKYTKELESLVDDWKHNLIPDQEFKHKLKTLLAEGILSAIENEGKK
jgi:hypothetical protein